MPALAVRPIVTVEAHASGKFSQDPSRVLTAESAPIEVPSSELELLVQDLLDTLEAHSICIGLAAPQIGVARRVVVVCPSRVRAEATVMVNPEVVREFGGKDKKRESCMSLPGWTGDVVRREKLTVRFLDLTGEAVEQTFSGFEARVVAHEIDHLAGVLYADRSREGGFPLAETDLFDRANFSAVQQEAEMS